MLGHDFDDNQQTATGDGARQAIGHDINIDSHDIYVLPDSVDIKRSLTKSCMHNLLEIFMSSITPDDGDFPLDPPPPLNEKLIYNHAPHYINIFANYSENWVRLEEVQRDFADSEIVLKRLHTMFLEVAETEADGTLKVGNGDDQLKNMENRLYRQIVNDAAFNADAASDEQIRMFCISLLALAVSKCKVLLRPGDDDVVA